VPDPDATTPDSADPTPPAKPPRQRRTRKFTLPDHHHDEGQDDRTDEHIEAFLTTRTRRRRPKPSGRVRRPIELDTRPDWMTALRHETARQERYGRPAAVLLIELVPGVAAAHGTGDAIPSVNGDGAWNGIDVLARHVADAIRAEARESDRAVRFGASSFRLLLPETGDRAARAVAQRIDQAVMANAEHLGSGAGLTIDVASPAGIGTLEDAVADAERRLAGRLAEAPG
jgi:diguanylate cyclase with GGDEF domain